MFSDNTISLLNVLVVDDSIAMHGVISATLNEVGVNTCRCVSSGEEALRLVKQVESAFHVLFIDLNMPGMDGMHLIRELAKFKYPGGIVILSELDEKIIQFAGEITKQHSAHLIGSLSKPLTQDKLIPTLNKLQTLRRIVDKKYESLKVKEIETAIKNKWLVPYYQPIINNQNGHVVSLEVLARISRPGESDAITAARFIETAEKNGLIEELTLTVFGVALDEYPALSEEFGYECKLAINISPLLLNNPDLPTQLKQIVVDKGFRAENFILEITESHAIEETAQFETLNRLRIQGFNLALDDYGTGFTNIQQLKNLPYTEIKIDRSLIYGIHRDKLSQVVTNSLFDIFGELDVQVVAEGMETAEDLNYLNELPIPIHLQGFVISKPKSLESISRWNRSWRKIVDSSSE